MWRSRLFWNLFITTGLLVFFSVALLGFVITNRAQENELKQIEQSLRDKAAFCREIIRHSEEIDAIRARLIAMIREQRARITLVTSEGTVVLDSHEDPMMMDNHRERPEIRQARQSSDGYGTSTRYSTTVNQSMMYVAIRMAGDSKIEFVRVALSLSTIEQRIAFFQLIVWTTSAVTVGVALILAFWLARRISAPLNELAHGAEQIGEGGFGTKVYVSGSYEVEKLASTFNHMSERLDDQFQQLDADRQRLRAVLGSMVEGVVAVDEDQKVLFANQRAVSLLDIQTGNPEGRHFWELVRQRRLLEIIHHAFVEQKPYQEEIEWAGPDSRILLVHLNPLGMPARGFVLVFHDVTELRHLEQMRQEFIANVSHELKTPLSVILAAAETLECGVDEEKTRNRFLRQIQDQGARLELLIQDMLTLGRIESASQIFYRQPLSLAKIVQGCIERQSDRASHLNRRLELGSTEDVLAWVDAEAMRDILDNLVDNGIKYTPENGRVVVSCGQINGEPFVQVSDSGIGIPEKDLPRIFERFYRVDKARSREMGGTGLGLAIVKHLVQEMKGRIEAESVVSKGTTITIYLKPPENGTGD